MHRKQKLLMTSMWVLLAMAIGGFIFTAILARRIAEPANATAGLQVLAPAPSFNLTNQDGKSVDDVMLQGHPYVVDLIFTRCGSVCPEMTTKMAALQHRITPDVKFVSVSVDPLFDTPEVLKKYARQYKADESRWLFLTGDESQITTFARGMLLAFEPASKDAPITHSDRFLLIDGQGQIRGVYRSGESDELSRLVTDATALAGQKSS